MARKKALPAWPVGWDEEQCVGAEAEATVQSELAAEREKLSFTSANLILLHKSATINIFYKYIIDCHIFQVMTIIPCKTVPVFDDCKSLFLPQNATEHTSIFIYDSEQ